MNKSIGSTPIDAVLFDISPDFKNGYITSSNSYRYKVLEITFRKLYWGKEY